MIERFIRFPIKRFLKGYTLSKVGKKAKKEKEVRNGQADIS